MRRRLCRKLLLRLQNWRRSHTLVQPAINCSLPLFERDKRMTPDNLCQALVRMTNSQANDSTCIAAGSTVTSRHSSGAAPYRDATKADSRFGSVLAVLNTLELFLLSAELARLDST